MKYANVGIKPADFLLPRDGVAHETWACVACDQYTSQPEYWQNAAKLVGDAPSCLKMVLPECWLPETEQRVPRIHQEMRDRLADGTLAPKVKDGFVLVERTTENGARLGLVCVADLEEYDFTGKKCLIRPTEETIRARLPARLAVRRGAPVESSHILMLMDDPARSVIEPLYALRDTLLLLYDFDLMQGGGHLRGWAITGDAEKAQLLSALIALKESLGEDPLLFAMGDGNHSLATAQAYWHEVRASLSPEEQAAHPARYAMVELENIHDEALLFEPIHRVLKGVDAGALMADWAAYCAARGMGLHVDGVPQGAQTVQLCAAGTEATIAVSNPDGPIPAATLQQYLDDFLNRNPAVAIDYIHGDDVLRQLAAQENAVGFLLPPVDKNTFFEAINTLGILPRKTFSMGHAHEKRFYMECRAIQA